MTAYSLDLRARVIIALGEEEFTQSEAAGQFGVSLSTIEKWWRRWHETGSIEPLPSASGPSRTLATYETVLRRLVQQQPDATLPELCARVEAQTGVRASPSMMCRELQRLNLPRKKKSLHDSQRETPRVKRKRRTFKKKHDRVVFARRAPEIYR